VQISSAIAVCEQVWYNTETYQKHTGGSTVYVPVNLNKVGQQICVLLCNTHFSNPSSYRSLIRAVSVCRPVAVWMPVTLKMHELVAFLLPLVRQVI